MPGELATEKPAESAGDGEKKEAPASKPMVGIIYPPPEVRNIVDKTADFVARNGPEFEERIKLNEAGNTKFNFLSPGDPYHAYYLHKIKEVQEGVVQEQLAASQQQAMKLPPKPAPVAMVTEPEPPKEPPPEWEFMAEPPSISATELDIVKLTAQFVARNGAQFLDKLMMREQRNYQFDFLRKQHPLFTYFTKLVEQHSKVLLPPHELIARIRGDLENPYAILDRVQKRVDWDQYQLRQKRKAEEEQEKERVEYSQVEWHDFILVETISFREYETGYLPAPIRPTQLAQRLLQQQKYERMAEEGGEVQEIEMEVEEQDGGEDEQKPEEEKKEQRPPSPPPPPLPTPPHGGGGIQIRRDYNPKVARPPPPQTMPSQQYLISPITGEKIPADKMQEHMRYGLLDPRWIEEQKQQIGGKRSEHGVYAEGVQIGSSLKQLAERRTDIFGVEETVIGRKIGEEREPQPNPTMQWDGHATSAEVVQRQAQSKVTIEEQIEAIHKAQGLTVDKEKERIGPAFPTGPRHHQPPLPPPQSKPPSGPPPLPQAMRPPLPPPLFPTPHPPTGMPPLPGGLQPPRPPFPLLPTPPMGSPQSMPPSFLPAPGFPLDIAPPVAKRPRTEAEELMPEQLFIANNPGSVTFNIHVPNLPDRSEWKLNGQVFAVTLPITDPVSVIKAKIFDELGMPTGKQKLQIGSIFIKDSNSLGYYNVSPSTIVQLGLKERGGRKK